MEPHGTHHQGNGRQQLPHGTQATGEEGNSSSSGGSCPGVLVPVMPVDTSVEQGG